MSQARAVVLVEGPSDQRAVETLAARVGRDLASENIAVLPMGGATNIGSFLRRFRHLQIAGLYDADQESAILRGLHGAGFVGADPARHRFFACRADLEDELIRALGPTRVERSIADHGELAALRSFENQPYQRGRPRDQQLRRFLGTRAGRKIVYAQALVEALGPDEVPVPLHRLLAAI